VTFSALGQEAPVAGKEAWDPDGVKKRTLRDYVAKEIPEFEVRVGGSTSIDVTKHGIDKAYGMKKLIALLGVAKEELIFESLPPSSSRSPTGGRGGKCRARGSESHRRLARHSTTTACSLRSGRSVMRTTTRSPSRLSTASRPR
jgi:hypothetical protein